MKNLKDSILEKLKVDNINTPSFAYDFPIKGDLKAITKYLKNNGFKEVDYDRIVSISLGTFIKNFNNLKEKAFGVYNKYDVTTIRFGDTSSKAVSEENPIFTISKNRRNDYWTLYIEIMTPWEIELSSSKWLEKLNKRFK